jgi:Ala-tRNA(Pro) deacylase
MIKSPHEDLLSFLRVSDARFKMLEHPPCRSSTESAAARASAGVPDAIGAKALVVMLGDNRTASVIVLPGPLKLDSKLLRKRFGRMRFASSVELESATGGLEAGMVPPFGKPVFSNIENLYVDENIHNYKLIGFNAACLDKSIVMEADDYLRICSATEVVALSNGN